MDSNLANFRIKHERWFRSKAGFAGAEIELQKSLTEYDETVQMIAMQLVRDDLLGIAEGCSQLLSQCESPIERDLLSAILVSGNAEVGDINFWQLPFDMSSRPTFHIEPQFKVGKFRIDFRFTLQLYNSETRELTIMRSVFVECDGHDFHERTKEQAQRDRSKDRFFQRSNLPLLRFTGSEIYADPFKCSSEIHTFLREKFMEGP